jgi:hypothetical protein
LYFILCGVFDPLLARGSKKTAKTIYMCKTNMAKKCKNLETNCLLNIRLEFLFRIRAIYKQATCWGAEIEHRPDGRARGRPYKN